jgi:hypothetical protein
MMGDGRWMMGVMEGLGIWGCLFLFLYSFAVMNYRMGEG